MRAEGRTQIVLLAAICMVACCRGWAKRALSRRPSLLGLLCSQSLFGSLLGLRLIAHTVERVHAGLDNWIFDRRSTWTLHPACGLAQDQSKLLTDCMLCCAGPWAALTAVAA